MNLAVFGYILWVELGILPYTKKTNASKIFTDKTAVRADI